MVVPSWARCGLIGAVAFAATACTASPAERICQQSAGAEVCLVSNENALKLRARGLQARSELVVTQNLERSMVVAVDHDGEAPEPGGVVGVLPGPDTQRLTVTGHSANGSDVHLTFEVPVARP